MQFYAMQAMAASHSLARLSESRDLPSRRFDGRTEGRTHIIYGIRVQVRGPIRLYSGSNHALKNQKAQSTVNFKPLAHQTNLL